MEKKKDNTQIMCLIISMIFVILSYWLLGNIIISLLNGLFFFYVIYKGITIVYRKVIKKIQTYEEFRNFANQLIMQLSVTPSINDAFAQISSMCDKKYHNILLDESLLLNEKLESLENYFPIPLFFILKHILLLYVEQGGNILEMSQELLSKCDIELVNMQEIFALNKHKWSESIIMWGFAILGFVYLRSALISYYLTLIENVSFMLCIEGFIILFISCLNISSKKYLKEQIE